MNVYKYLLTGIVAAVFIAVGVLVFDAYKTQPVFWQVTAGVCSVIIAGLILNLFYITGTITTPVYARKK